MLNPHFEWKKVSFDDFLVTTWEQENESQRKKEPQIPRPREQKERHLSSRKGKAWCQQFLIQLYLAPIIHLTCNTSVIEYLTLNNNNQCPIMPKNAMNQLTNFVTNRPNYSSQQCFLTKLAWFLPIRANILLLSCNKADLLGMKRVKVRVREPSQITFTLKGG